MIETSNRGLFYSVVDKYMIDYTKRNKKDIRDNFLDIIKNTTHPERWQFRLPRFYFFTAFYYYKELPKSNKLSDLIAYCLEKNLDCTDVLYDFIYYLNGMTEQMLKGLDSDISEPEEHLNHIVSNLDREKDLVNFYRFLQESSCVSIFENLIFFEKNDLVFSLEIDTSNYAQGAFLLKEVWYTQRNRQVIYPYNYPFKNITQFKKCLDLFESIPIEKDWFDIIGY